MVEFNSLLNTCFITTEASRTIAYYSHLIPIFFTLALALLVYLKAPKNLLTKVFLAFSIVFSFWLVADLVTWVSNDYSLVYAFWAPVDYIETVMYILGAYFVIVFVNKSDISWFKKLLLFLATLPPFFITITQKSVWGLNYPVCEAINNNFLLDYRFFIEILVVIIILIYTINPFFKKSIAGSKKSRLIVLGSMFLFLVVFGSTSYLSAVTAYYEMNLYALFIIPVFLIAITYSIFSLDIFNVKTLGTYFIVFGFIILSASQLIFVTSTTNKLLIILTVLLSVVLSYLLFKNLKKETDQRVYIEKLSVELNISNEKLKGLDKLKTEFVSLASHQLRSPLTAIKGYASMLMDGDYGEMSKEAKEAIDRMYQSSKNLTIVVEDLLNVTKIESGGMKFEMALFDLSEVVGDEAKDFSMTAEKKGLKLNFEKDDNVSFMVNGDKEKIRQIIINFIDNSLKYTKEGSVNVSIKNQNNKVVFCVKDTGMGMTENVKESLFQKFARGDGARMNTTGSGLGLYLAKQIVEAHKGRVWVESEGEGKGSAFFMELDAVSN
ncbi:MAG: HAMP domain-containing sensor histidine kinase [Candidatus Paceibacterota bacterium]|jgi:signal transduction histidine kinase